MVNVLVPPQGGGVAGPSTTARMTCCGLLCWRSAIRRSGLRTVLLTARRTSGIAFPGPAGHSWLARFVLGEMVVNGFMVYALTTRRGTTPGQGGMQILAAATLADVVDVDVPVNMQHKFQQSLVFIQFINRVVVIPVATQKVCTALSCRRPLRFHSCSSWT